MATGLRLPEPECNWDGIDIKLLPPCYLVSRAMKLPMVEPTNRNEKLVAYSAPKRVRLRESQVMRVRRRAATDKASLPHNELAVIFVA